MSIISKKEEADKKKINLDFDDTENSKIVVKRKYYRCYKLSIAIWYKAKILAGTAS